MGVHNHQQRTGSTHPERYEALLVKRVRIFARQRVVIGKYRSRLRKGNTMLAEVGFSFAWVPIDLHAG